MTDSFVHIDMAGLELPMHINTAGLESSLGIIDLGWESQSTPNDFNLAVDLEFLMRYQFPDNVVVPTELGYDFELPHDLFSCIILNYLSHDFDTFAPLLTVSKFCREIIFSGVRSLEIKRPLANEKDFIFRAPVDTMMSYPEMTGWMKAPKALGKFKNLDAFRLKKFDLRIFGIDLSHVGNKKFIFKNIKGIENMRMPSDGVDKVTIVRTRIMRGLQFLPKGIKELVIERCFVYALPSTFRDTLRTRLAELRCLALSVPFPPASSWSHLATLS